MGKTQSSLTIVAAIVAYSQTSGGVPPAIIVASFSRMPASPPVGCGSSCTSTFGCCLAYAWAIWDSNVAT